MKALIISDSPSLRQEIRSQILDFQLEISIVGNLKDALGVLDKGENHIVLTDVLCPGDPQILKAALKGNPEVKVITVSKKMEIGWLIKTLAQGAFDYVDLDSPFQMRNSISRAVELAIAHIKSGGAADEETERRACR